MSSRGEQRVWLIGLSIPVAILAITLLGILSAPGLPVVQQNRETNLALVLLLGVFLLICGIVATVAIILWKKSQITPEMHHELIATLPSSGEGSDEA